LENQEPEPKYGSNLSKIISDKINKTAKKYVGTPITPNSLEEIKNNIINTLKTVSYIPTSITQINVEVDQLDPTKINFTFPIFYSLLEYKLLNPYKDNHTWTGDKSIILDCPSYKCTKCGLKMIINNGWKLAKQDLTCEEMLIKDIIE